MSTSPYPVQVVGGHDLGRSRLTVFFRPFLVIPHIVVLWLYAIGANVVVFIAWFAALFTGRVPEGMHGFVAGYLRYNARVTAYMMLLADPFPPFGSGGTYPVDVEIAPAVKQGRLGVFFRYLLAIPALFAAGALGAVLYLVSIGCWFVAIVAGRVPEGLQNLGMFCLRFGVRSNAYLYLVNPRYPAFGTAPGSLPTDQTALPPIP